MDWFTELFGFTERDYAGTQALLALQPDGQLRVGSEQSARYFSPGALQLPSLASLREQVAALPKQSGANPMWRAVATDAAQLHRQPEAHGALVQVASQFNLLEMPSPNVTPEAGITAYAYDHTQGPACALACAAGTLVRNYLVALPGGVGQTAQRQINTLQDVLAALEGMGLTGFEMRNGYLMAAAATMQATAQKLRALDAAQHDQLRQRLQIGVQHHSQVTAAGAPAGQKLTQAYCAALPIAYNRGDLKDWGPMARLVLEATYEATLLAGVLNAHTTGNPRVYLTLVGGGVFGNPVEWILQAIERALQSVEGHSLDVVQVCYRAIPSQLTQAIQQFNEAHP